MTKKLNSHLATSTPIWSVKGLVRAFSKPLVLRLNQQALEYRSTNEFEFALNARVGVPTLRLTELTNRTVRELDDELLKLNAMLRQFKGICDDQASLKISSLDAIKRTGTAIFSKDHEWRAIFQQMIETQGVTEQYFLLALRHYCRYLAARIETLEFLIDSRARWQTGGLADLAASVEPSMPESTTVFIDQAANDSAQPGPTLHRLPQGKQVALTLADGQRIAIRLAAHDFALSKGRGWHLISQEGEQFELHRGVNSVGRSAENDISVRSSFQNVSRRHLLAEPLDGSRIALTDLSSGGTYVPPNVLTG